MKERESILFSEIRELAFLYANQILVVHYIV